MFRHLEFLLRELSLSLDGIDLIAVAAGPGSFTGLRVGLAAAKGWAEVYEKPIAAVSALEAVAAQSRSNAQLIVPVLDARRGEVYFGFYRHVASPGRNELALEGEECVGTPDEFLQILKGRPGNSDMAIVTPTPEVISGVLSRNEIACPPAEEVSNVLAPFIGQLGYRRFQQGKLVDALTLDANYVRHTDAELHWKKSQGS